MAITKSLKVEHGVGRRLIDWVDRHMTVVFNIPTVVFLFGLVAFPVALVLLTSMTDWQLILNPDPDFVGFKNYITAWQDPRWINAVGHTFYYAILSVGGQFVLGMATALLFNRSFAGKAFYRSVDDADAFDVCGDQPGLDFVLRLRLRNTQSRFGCNWYRTD